MAVEIISWSFSMKVWDRTGIELATPVSADRHISAPIEWWFYPFYGDGSVVFDFLFIVTPIVGNCNCSMFCWTLLYVQSSIATILMGKRELVALLNLSSWCLVMVELLLLAVPWGRLRFVIVVFPDHTHLLLLCWVFVWRCNVLGPF